LCRCIIIFKLCAYCSNSLNIYSDNEVGTSYVWSRYVSLKMAVMAKWQKNSKGYMMNSYSTCNAHSDLKSTIIHITKTASYSLCDNYICLILPQVSHQCITPNCIFKHTYYTYFCMFLPPWMN